MWAISSGVALNRPSSRAILCTRMKSGKRSAGATPCPREMKSTIAFWLGSDRAARSSSSRNWTSFASKGSALVRVCFTTLRLSTSRRWLSRGASTKVRRACFASSSSGSGGGRSAALASAGSTNKAKWSSINCSCSAALNDEVPSMIAIAMSTSGASSTKANLDRSLVGSATGCVSATTFSKSFCSDCKRMIVASSAGATPFPGSDT